MKTKDAYCCRGYFMCPLHEDETHDFMTDSLLVNYGVPVCGRCYQDMAYYHRSSCMAGIIMSIQSFLSKEVDK